MDEDGVLAYITILDPLAGIDLAFQIVQDIRWKIQSIRLRFNAAGTGSPRQMVLGLKTQGGEEYYLPSVETQIDTENFIYTWMPGVEPTADTAVQNNRVLNPIPLDWVVGSGDTIFTDIENIQATDVISEIEMRVLEKKSSKGVQSRASNQLVAVAPPLPS